MPRAVTYALTAATCAIALACGHEMDAPSAVPTALPAAPTVTATATATPSPHPTACIDVEGDHDNQHITLEGRIVVDNAFEHPSRGKTHPFILQLDAPRCAIGTEEPRVVELHLAPGEDVVLKPLVGKHVRVSGDPFAAHTAWHARPIVLMTTTVTPSS